MRQNTDVDVRLVLLSDSNAPAGHDPRLYNQPTGDAVAAILPGDGDQPVDGRDIILTTKDGKLRRIWETHPAYTPLNYVFMFPYGSNGWTFTVKQTDGRSKVCSALFSTVIWTDDSAATHGLPHGSTTTSRRHAEHDTGEWATLPAVLL
jgi:hypothetical protein